MEYSKQDEPNSVPIAFVFDGIRENEAAFPKWWKSVFVSTLMLCPFYMLFYHSGAPGRTMADSYESALAANSQKLLDQIGTLEPNEATVVKYMNESNWVKVGRVIFKSKCATCHGREGEGNIGPNLTDDSFKNIRQVEDIVQVILKGANNNAMPAWEEKLQPNEIVLVSAYVASLRGTNVAGGKAAEGGKIPAWPTLSELDRSAETAPSP